ncbi:hypothetical protein TEA_004612 [Camellia sinensis var. sinensis]|uniref:UBA domain-containing protein n=1 Tax=Camellia sinensis var. sinensis TaxID=542762 RepID=A0A4S4DH72_CAMSN|nr:hypothetical protein TEA_004612 [Camellia sinensis var. sinensis]
MFSKNVVSDLNETAPHWVNVLTVKTSVSSVSLSQSLPQLSFPLFQNPRFEALTLSRSVSNTHSLARSLNFSFSTLDLLDCRSKTLDGLHFIDLCRSQSNSLAILHRSLSLEGFALAVLHRTRTRSVLYQIDLFCSSSNRRSKIQNRSVLADLSCSYISTHATSLLSSFILKLKVTNLCATSGTRENSRTQTEGSAPNRSQGPEFEAKVTRLIELGFGREAVVQALKFFDGNEDQAAGYLFGA